MHRRESFGKFFGSYYELLPKFCTISFHEYFNKQSTPGPVRDLVSLRFSTCQDRANI